jgi:hypothetical protein
MVENFEPLVRKTFANEADSRWLLGAELEVSWKLRKELSLEGNVSALFWLNNPNDASPTLGNPDQNSTVTAWLGARSQLLGDRLSLALGAGYSSPRNYNLRAGIPPILLAVNAGNLVRIEASVNYHLVPTIPLWITFKALSFQPNASVESPLPNSSLLGTTLLVGLEYR